MFVLGIHLLLVEEKYFSPKKIPMLMTDFHAMHYCTFSFSFVSTLQKPGNRSGEGEVYECEYEMFSRRGSTFY